MMHGTTPIVVVMVIEGRGDKNRTWVFTGMKIVRVTRI